MALIYVIWGCISLEFYMHTDASVVLPTDQALCQHPIFSEETTPCVFLYLDTNTVTEVGYFNSNIILMVLLFDCKV